MSQKYNKTEVWIKKISYQAERLDDGLAFFDFYDPSQQRKIEHELNYFQDIYYRFYGGQSLSERKMLCLSTDEIKENVLWPIRVCIAHVDFDVDHRMVLGNIMQLGITRDIIGDIIIQNQRIQIVVKEQIAQYISMNIQRLNNKKVYFEVHDISCLCIKEQSYKTEYITVSSFRLDAIISAAYGISRERVTEMIKKHNVKINHEEKIKPASNGKIGDLFSVKGKGRFILEEFIGTTKKEKNKIRIKKYM